jgi:hypothetical protein
MKIILVLVFLTLVSTAIFSLANEIFLAAFYSIFLLPVSVYSLYIIFFTNIYPQKGSKSEQH